MYYIIIIIISSSSSSSSSCHSSVFWRNDQLITILSTLHLQDTAFNIRNVTVSGIFPLHTTSHTKRQSIITCISVSDITRLAPLIN
jgi:hypothetical protein